MSENRSLAVLEILVHLSASIPNKYVLGPRTESLNRWQFRSYGEMTKFLALQPRTSEYVFARGSAPINDFRESWHHACVRAGVPNLLFHDLRRTAVRNLRLAGVAETIIMKITGHLTRSVFERYNITDQTDTQAIGRMAEQFLAQEHTGVAK